MNKQYTYIVGKTRAQLVVVKESSRSNMYKHFVK